MASWLNSIIHSNLPGHQYFFVWSTPWMRTLSRFFGETAPVNEAAGPYLLYVHGLRTLSSIDYSGADLQSPIWSCISSGSPLARLTSLSVHNSKACNLQVEWLQWRELIERFVPEKTTSASLHSSWQHSTIPKLRTQTAIWDSSCLNAASPLFASQYRPLGFPAFRSAGTLAEQLAQECRNLLLLPKRRKR